MSRACDPNRRQPLFGFKFILKIGLDVTVSPVLPAFVYNDNHVGVRQSRVGGVSELLRVVRMMNILQPLGIRPVRL